MAAIMSRTTPATAAGASCRSRAPCRVAPAMARRRSLVVRAAASPKVQDDALVQFANSIGLPTREGLFGFRPFAEVWVGRLAMMGFVTSIVEEAITGQGTLQQLGLASPSPELLTLLCALAGGATLAGTAHTAYRLATKQFSPADMARYRTFLGLNNANDFVAVAAAMKRRGDFTSLSPDAAAIDAVRAEGMPADRVLAVAGAAEQAEQGARDMKAADASVLTLTKAEEAAQVAAAAAEAKAAAQAGGPSVALAARADILEQDQFASAELAYARQVELDNGRWAMLGFLAAVLVEAGTGHGILGQLIMWFKLSGLLGAASGF